MFPMLFLIVIPYFYFWEHVRKHFENTRNPLGSQGNFIETSWRPLGNLVRTFWEHQIEKNKNNLEINFKTSFKNKPNIGPT
jgi:hypothetical protein